MPRGFAYAVAVEDRGTIVGYGAIRTTDDEAALVEFYVTEGYEPAATVRAILDFSKAPLIEVQSNLPFSKVIQDAFAIKSTSGPILFANGDPTLLKLESAKFRAVNASDQIFEHQSEPIGDWCIEVDGVVVATGGFFTHYNPPFADLYMEVSPPFRRKGIGSFLIQELRAVCLNQSYVPAARCNFDNVASAKCLQRGGMVVCGNITTVRVRL